ncbi:hypothetical protein B0H13DRAFT_2679730 [Mycena leptocephala]|nr:hypothetical protein B0H13DRAFT_2679730 [Mycena leptocephala]
MTYPPLGESWPLPSRTEIGLDHRGVSAWDLLLSAEQAALALPKPTAKYQDKLVAVRLLGWFLKDFWESQRSTAYSRLLLEINSCNRTSESVGPAERLQECHDKVFTLGLDLRNHLIRVFYTRTDRTPTPSAHASRPSYEKHRADILKDMANVKPSEGRTHSQAKGDALLRDGYKCVITGLYDTVTVSNFPEVRAKAKQEGVTNMYSQVSHLFSASAQSHPDYAASAMAILKMFGLESSVNKLLGKRVNNLWNVMTLCLPLHKAFDEFLFWLEAVPGEEHTYNVVARDPGVFFDSALTIPRKVKFSIDPQAVMDCARNNIPLELPDPELMAMRAACARVAAMSGAADQFRLLMLDRDDAEMLTDTTVYLLDSLLHTLPIGTVNVGA